MRLSYKTLLAYNFDQASVTVIGYGKNDSHSKGVALERRVLSTQFVIEPPGDANA